MSDPNPVGATDLEWWAAYGMCGGCGTAECHDGPCSEVASTDPFDGARTTVCGRCPTRQAAGEAPAVHVVPTADVIGRDVSGDCGCGPARLTESGQVIAVHHAIDGRESAQRQSWSPIRWSEAMWFANSMSHQAGVRYRVTRGRFGWTWGPVSDERVAG